MHAGKIDLISGLLAQTAVKGRLARLPQ